MLLWTLGGMYHFKLLFLFFFKHIPRSGIGRSYGSSVFNFWDPPYCFPQWLHQFTFPSLVCESSLFSTSLPICVLCVLFDDSHSDRCGVSSLWFSFVFPWWLVMLSIFSCVCSPSAFLFGKIFIQFFCLLFNFLLCGMACRILVPWPGTEPRPW